MCCVLFSVDFGSLSMITYHFIGFKSTFYIIHVLIWLKQREKIVNIKKKFRIHIALRYCHLPFDGIVSIWQTRCSWAVLHTASFFIHSFIHSFIPSVVESAFSSKSSCDTCHMSCVAFFLCAKWISLLLEDLVSTRPTRTKSSYKKET